MYGKDIIDILIGAEDPQSFEKLKQLLQSNYVASKKNQSHIYQFFASTSEETKQGDIHIHLVVKNTKKYQDFILLKEYLLRYPEKAKEYSDFKRNLLKIGITDREDYKKTKSQYVEIMLECARKLILEEKMNNHEYIGKIVKIKIDRPLGSKHPKHGFIYPVNYGYVPNTVSGDGEELDCYLLGVFEPLTEYEGRCIAIIHRTNDNDDKLVIVPDTKEYTDDAINALTEFQEQYFEHIILRS